MVVGFRMGAVDRRLRLLGPWCVGGAGLGVWLGDTTGAAGAATATGSESDTTEAAVTGFESDTIEKAAGGGGLRGRYDGGGSGSDGLRGPAQLAGGARKGARASCRRRRRCRRASRAL